MSRPKNPSRAFTLMEMMLSLVVMTIIVAATTSAMRLMLRTASSAQVGTTATGSTSRAAVDQVIDDLKLALTVPEQTPTAVTMTVPDRDGDGQPETIRYSWSGVAGESLKRSYNGAVAVSIADNINSFNIQHILRTTGPAPAATVESGEQLLAASNALLLVANFAVTSSNESAQYFSPTLPANTVSWKVTRIRAEVKRNGSATGNIQFDVTAADSSYLPSGSALDSGLISVATVGANQADWVEFPCTALANLNPGQGLCLVARSSNSSTIYSSRYAAVSLSGAGYFMTRTSGGSWGTPSALQTMQFYVYGTVTTQP